MKDDFGTWMHPTWLQNFILGSSSLVQPAVLPSPFCGFVATPRYRPPSPICCPRQPQEEVSGEAWAEIREAIAKLGPRKKSIGRFGRLSQTVQFGFDLLEKQIRNVAKAEVRTVFGYLKRIP